MKSPQLRKYRDIYDLILKKNKIKKKVTFNPKKSIKIITPQRSPERSPEKKEKSLNSYQLFLQSESSKNKYKKISPKSRMKSIARAWKKKKNK